MGPERYQRVKELFHAALEREPDERSAFLTEACRGDASLRADVEALLAAHERPSNFLDAPLHEFAAGLLRGGGDASLAGRRLGHYQVIELLGAGGMGEVYLARDTRLGRKVALKLLPSDLASDEEFIRRFEQEARAASALNHPNILTIYDIEQTGGRYFIATEFVEGVTLRQRMQAGGMRLTEALAVAAQLAGALAKAHQNGIVHRDVKPENVMVGGEGQIKLLDFGLAKFTPAGRGQGSEVSAAVAPQTVPGLVIGTTAYMSPEQARGLAVDARTDVWSLCVVLYELAAGRPPFDGPTRSDLIVALLEREPERPLGAGGAVPDELWRIIRKGLQKERERRYQTMKDLALDLESLRRELGEAAGPSRRPPPAAGRAAWSEADVRDELTAPGRGRGDGRPAGRNRRAAALLATGLLSAAVVFAGIRMWPAPGPARPEAAGAAPAAEPERRLDYWLLVQKYRDGRPYQDPFKLAEKINFEKDYQLKLNLRSSQAGHLYILNEGPATPGRPSPYVILFPSPTANGGTSLVAGEQQIQIPERSWFRFDDEEGTEKVWLVWSVNSVPALEAVGAFANPRDRGLVADPDLNNSVRQFLEAPRLPPPAEESDEIKKEIAIKFGGDILVHLLRFEHH